MGLVLYSNGGGIWRIDDAADDAANIKEAVTRVLRARKDDPLADLHARVPFTLKRAVDEQLDHTHVLVATVPLRLYEETRLFSENRRFDGAFERLAKIYAELKHWLTCIEIELDVKTDRKRGTLPPARIRKLVYHYIGVVGGYLGDFSYSKHTDFYTDLGLDIDPNKVSGTTRQRFETILERSDPHTQAKILRGILDRYPVLSSPGRTQKLHDEIEGWEKELRSGEGVVRPELQVTSEVVHRALSDADHLLLQPGGATSAVDRAHTALHGYLREICKGAGISYGQEDSLGSLLKSIRTQHPAFANMGPRPEEITQILNSFAGVLAVLNPIRNQASVAHANEALLPKAEAMLVINAVRTIMHFLDAKISPEARATENG
jgi:hypothetical protein